MAYNKKPKMILFDVGGTLFDDGPCIPIDGLAQLRPAAINPDITDNTTLALLWDEYMTEITGLKSKSDIPLDMPLSAPIKYVTMKSGLKFDIPMIEQEEIFDRYNSSRKVIDGVPELLYTLHSLSIRTAVISNNAMSGESLALALKRWIPNVRFEFCLTSADILYCKPCKDIFLTASGYANLDPSECWYCGDSFIPDILGSSGVGMTPVLLDTKSNTPFKVCENESTGKYITVNNWNSLKEHIENLSE